MPSASKRCAARSARPTAHRAFHPRPTTSDSRGSKSNTGDQAVPVNLGISDPNRADDRGYWQQVDLNFQLWTEPDEPFETTFSVSESTTNATLELNTNRHRAAETGQDADFEVTFVSPDGEEIEAERSQLTDSGRVNLGALRRPSQTDGTYASQGSHQTFTDELDDPAAGEWAVRIMPTKTMDFEYEFTRTEDN